jgi:hypothetical protein
MNLKPVFTSFAFRGSDAVFFVCVTSGILNLNPTGILAESVQGNFFLYKKNGTEFVKNAYDKTKKCARYTMFGALTPNYGFCSQHFFICCLRK